MIRYRVQFTHGNWIYLSAQQLEILNNTAAKFSVSNPGMTAVPIDAEYPFIQIKDIQYIHKEEMPTGSSTVIKAKTPTELREEKERKEQTQAPATLDEQLSKIE